MEEHTHPPVHLHPHKKEEGLNQLSLQQAIVLNGLIIAAGIIIAALMMTHAPAGTTGAKVGATAGASQGATAAIDIKNVKTSGDPFIGNPNAPVVLAYWSDYQCPYCKQFETTTFQNILKDYVASGKVAVVFKDFSFLGPDSDTAAVYARSVWTLYPNQFYAWRTALFDAQDKENGGFGDEPSVEKLTGTVAGIDAAKVAADVKKNRDAYMKEVEADKSEGASFGIQGTPSFITGATLIPGVVPYGTFTDAFDAQLKK